MSAIRDGDATLAAAAVAVATAAVTVSLSAGQLKEYGATLALAAIIVVLFVAAREVLEVVSELVLIVFLLALVLL